MQPGPTYITHLKAWVSRVQCCKTQFKSWNESQIILSMPYLATVQYLELSLTKLNRKLSLY